MKRIKPPTNRQLRTRRDLLAATRRLLRRGRVPNMEDVAAEALVSRPTAYRYFRSIDALLREAAVDEAVAISTESLVQSKSADPIERLLEAEAAMHRSCYENEPLLRVMLAASIAHDPADDALPVRQNRRLPLIEQALAPARKRLRPGDYRRLCAALALVFGPESMIVFRDVLRIDEPAARDVKAFAIRALVRHALAARA